MTDIHNHLLFGVDDGAKSLEESIRVLEEMELAGYENVILTPHYIKDSSYHNSRVDNLHRLDILKSGLRANNININLYLGNEIYIDDDIYELLNKGLISSLNNSNYLLIELPMSGIYDNYMGIFKDLINRGYNVILAHPERYISFQNDFNKIYELEKIGVYFQSNIASLVGKYGDGAKQTIIRLLKEKKIAFLATDIHHAKHDYHMWIEARDEALKYITLNEYELLVNKNPKVLTF